MTTDVSRRVLRNWARRVTKSVTRNFVVASRTSPGSSRAGRMMSEIASPAASGSLAAASSPERAKKKEFSTSLIIISSILANYRSDLTVKIMSRTRNAKKRFPYSFNSPSYVVRDCTCDIWHRSIEVPMLQSNGRWLVGPSLSRELNVVTVYGPKICIRKEGVHSAGCYRGRNWRTRLFHER